VRLLIVVALVWGCSSERSTSKPTAEDCEPMPVEGTSCSSEGRHCPVPGMCNDPCKRCLVMVCTDGVWKRVEELPGADCER
jgi:hypothetical protein